LPATFEISLYPSKCRREYQDSGYKENCFILNQQISPLRFMVLFQFWHYDLLAIASVKVAYEEPKSPVFAADPVTSIFILHCWAKKLSCS
jgi:hypothetical protein